MSGRYDGPLTPEQIVAIRSQYASNAPCWRSVPFTSMNRMRPSSEDDAETPAGLPHTP